MMRRRLPLARTGVATAALAVASLCACAPESAAVAVATLELGLSDVPAEVANVTVVIRSGEEIVASATVAPTRRVVALGVPAEVPLEITVLARTARPGPVGVGRMPAYVGRLVRSVPLAAEVTQVTVTLRPAGVLTVVAPPAPDVPRTPVIFEAIDGEQRGPRLRLREPGYTQSYVVRAGHYRARFDLEPRDDAPPFTLDATGSVFVEREQESVYVLSARESPELDPGAPVSLVLDAPGEAVAVGAAVPIVITASTGEGMTADDPAARVDWRVDNAPSIGALVEPDGDAAGTIAGLPAALALVGRVPTRAWLAISARLGDERTLAASQVVEVRAGPDAPAAALVARLADVDARRTGTELLIELVDAAGQYARASTVTVDLSASDPWVDLGGPPVLSISPRERGRVVRRVAVASGVRGRPIAIRLTATSTITGLVSTATIALPPIDLP